MKRVEVEWLDSVIVNKGGWMDAADLDDEGLTHFSCGYLVKKTPLTISLALDRTEDGKMIGCVTQIPRKAIVRITPL